MIYDCFTIRDELDLLELRLKILDNNVDKFVISEANYTHKGIEKPYTFLENEKRFDKWKNKIIYLPVDFSDEVSNNIHNTNVWSLENKQREALFYGMENCTSNDIILIGDLDEIVNNIPNEINIPHCFVQNLYYYYVNNKSIGPKDQYWVGTIACNSEHLKNYSPEKLRECRWNLKPIYNGGWHWSYLGGEQMIRNKLTSIVEGSGILSDNKINVEQAMDNFKNLKDLYGRKDSNFSIINFEKEYPENILLILKDYPKFIYKSS